MSYSNIQLSTMLRPLLSYFQHFHLTYYQLKESNCKRNGRFNVLTMSQFVFALILQHQIDFEENIFVYLF